MTLQKIRFAMLAMLVMSVALFMAGAAQAATITAGPTGQYPSPCAAFPHLQDGDTLVVDANGGVPYVTSDCLETANNVTISGVNGRPIVEPGTRAVYKGLWLIDGHDVVIDNFEFRNTAPSAGSSNRPALRIEPGLNNIPGGGNVTVEQCYIYNDGMGLLADNAGGGDNPTAGPYATNAWYSPNPYITVEYSEFADSTGEGNGLSHNIYIGFGGNMTFNMKYSFSHDNHGGHEVKSRAEHSNLYYNFIGDLQGVSDYILDFPLGGDAYVVGNIFYKAEACDNCNAAFISYRQYNDTDVSGAYPAPHDDMHFVNNTAIDGPGNSFTGMNQFVGMGCYSSGVPTNECPLPTGGGGPLTTPGVFENNIFVGPAGFSITNQTEAVLHGNVVLPNNSTNLADLFVDPTHLDFHLASGSPAIGAGIYPPTDNTGAADPLALATNEYVHPVSGTARPTPSGAAMDAGAYAYPRTDTPPQLQLAYNNTVTAPQSGTITVSGLPAPPSGRHTILDFVSGNMDVIPQIQAAETDTGSVTVTYQTVPVTSTVTVPIDIYADGAHAVATITVNPGPPTLYGITRDSEYQNFPGTTVHLEGPAPAGGLVVTLSSSDPTVLWAPTSVTVPAGALSAETGTLEGSLFSPSPQTATLTASAGSVTKTLAVPLLVTFIHSFDCDNCSVVGGQQLGAYFQLAGLSPQGGSTVYITSSNTAVIPNQSYFLASGVAGPPQFTINLNTNPVTTATPVTLTCTYNGLAFYVTPTVTVTPPVNTLTATSGSGQTAAVGTNFPNPLVVTASNGTQLLEGTTITFSGTNVTFPNGSTAVTNAQGVASVVAQPALNGTLTITASSPGFDTPATFTETGTDVPTSIAAVSGAGQTASVGLNYANPLVAIVKDAKGNPIQGLTVTFAGTGVSFPSGATAVTNASGDASVVASPTQAGNLTVSASVEGLDATASFPEKATPKIVLTSVTVDGNGPGTTVNLSTPATVPVVVQLSSSDPSALWAPASITIPVGASSAETGSMLGSVWTPPTAKTAVLTASYDGVTKMASVTLTPPTIHFFKCSPASCKDVVGGNPYLFMLKVDGNAPHGGGTVQITSDNPAAFPNQTIPIPQGQTIPPPFKLSLNTSRVTATAAVTVTATYGSVVVAGPISVTPPGVATSITAVSGSGQATPVNTTPFPNPLVVVVKDSNGNPVSAGVTVTFAGTGVSFPSGATAMTDASGQAQITAQPTEAGALTITASVSGVKTSASFSETGNPPPASVAAVSGSGQTATVGTNFTNPLVVVVKDASGNLVPGAKVTFAGAGVAFPSGATAITNASGEASVLAQPGHNSLGALTVTATVPGVSTPATFTETGKAGAPASLAAVSGSGQTATAGANFAAPLVAVVKDQYGNPVSAGVTVTFAGTGVSFPSGATAVTDANGEAQATANPTKAGPMTITASAAGTSAPAVFSETVTAGAPTSVVAISGSGQSAETGNPFAAPLVAAVRDQYGNPVSGVAVTFAGNGVSFPGGTASVTGTNGEAQTTVQAGGAGTFTVTASATGVSGTATFTLASVQLASITAPGYAPQSIAVNLTGPAPAGGAVVTLSSSNPSVVYMPATVTVPAGKTSAYAGALIGSLWGQSPAEKPATVTASYGGVTQSATQNFATPFLHGWPCIASANCHVTGGQPMNWYVSSTPTAPVYGSNPITFTSDNPAVIPSQTFNTVSYQGMYYTLPTNAVSTATVVHVTITYNGFSAVNVVTVNP